MLLKTKICCHSCWKMAMNGSAGCTSTMKDLTFKL